MKMIKISSLLVLTALAGVFSGCDDDSTDGVSFVTSYPTFELEGGEIISMIKGGSFTDPGFSATEGGTQLEVAVTGSVDASTAGLYVLTYSAVNSDGFPGTAERQVVITNEDVSATDISGDYYRNNNTSNPVNEVTKLANGYYKASNGSGDSNNIAMVFIHTDSDNLLIPVQKSTYGRFEGTGKITQTGYTISFTFLDPPNTGFTINRSFTKQ